MKTSEKIYLAETMLHINTLLGDIYDGSYVEADILDKHENDELGAQLECLLNRIEKMVDAE